VIATHILEVLAEQGFSAERWGQRITATRVDARETLTLTARPAGETWLVDVRGRGRSLSGPVRWSHELRELLAHTFPRVPVAALPLRGVRTRQAQEVAHA
jgi:arylamine N-acetyltransferase